MNVFIRPTKGLKVRDPDLLDILPEQGREVALTMFWQQRINHKDVVVSSPQTANTAQPTQPEDKS